MSDNELEFIEKSYKNFNKQWDLTLSGESNGQVERANHMVKKTLCKAFDNNYDPYLALLATRVSPDPYDNTPPATPSLFTFIGEV